MLRLFLHIAALLVAATTLTLFMNRFVLQETEEARALELLGGQASLHAQTICDTPPSERREKAAALSERLGVRLRLEPQVGPLEPRAEWRGTRVYVIASVPDSHGQLALGPLPPGPIASLPSALLYGLALGLLLAFFTAKRVYRTIHELDSIAKRMRAGDFAARVARKEGDIFDSIGDSLNQLGERIGQLVLDERDLLRTVAHEVRAPIARMRFRVEKIERFAAKEEKKTTDGLVSDLAQVDNLFEELLTYVAFDEFDQDRPKLQATNLCLLKSVRHVVEEVTATEEEIEVSVHGPEDAVVVANQKLFERAVTNLVLNAMAYGGPKIHIDIREFEEECVVDVQDSGPGIREEERRKVVKPFVRLSKKKIRGTGLGLAIVTRIMRLHAGQLHIVDAPKGGASIQLVWQKEPMTKNLVTPS